MPLFRHLSPLTGASFPSRSRLGLHPLPLMKPWWSRSPPLIPDAIFRTDPIITQLSIPPESSESGKWA